MTGYGLFDSVSNGIMNFRNIAGTETVEIEMIDNTIYLTSTASAGPQGERGYQGVQGPTGINGINGERGYQGVQGPMGYQGNIGPQGYGLTGFQGPAGPSGIIKNINYLWRPHNQRKWPSYQTTAALPVSEDR